MNLSERVARLEQDLARLKREKTSIGAWDEQNLFVDKTGEIRIRAWVGRQGLNLSLTDKNGNIRTVLGVKDDGPWLSLVDENQKKRVELNADNDGQGLGLPGSAGDFQGRLPGSALKR